MMRSCVRIPVLTMLLLLLSSALPAQYPSAKETPQLRIVVHADNPVNEISSRDLSKIFYKKLTRWESWQGDYEKAAIIPVDREKTAQVRETFSRAIFGKTATSIFSYWQRQVFSGNNFPPSTFASDEEILHFVSQNPGAVGYVSAATPLYPGVRSLAVSDVATATDNVYASAGYHDSPRRARDEIVDRRGEVRILLRGSCGQGGEGRTAILQHRDRYGHVQVTTETSRWRDGARQTSSRRTHTLSGDEEIRLGCTRAGSAELRYALVGSSDNSVKVNPVRAHRAPSRDFIVLTESGTCGRGGLGRFVALVNQHPERSIQVYVEAVRRLDGRLKNRSMGSYRLKPGGEKELGCNLDGALEQEYSVLEAN